MDIDFIIQDTYALTRPQWKFAGGFEEAGRAFAEIVSQHYKAQGRRSKSRLYMMAVLPVMTLTKTSRPCRKWKKANLRAKTSTQRYDTWQLRLDITLTS